MQPAESTPRDAGDSSPLRAIETAEIQIREAHFLCALLRPAITPDSQQLKCNSPPHPRHFSAALGSMDTATTREQCKQERIMTTLEKWLPSEKRAREAHARRRRADARQGLRTPADPAVQREIARADRKRMAVARIATAQGDTAASAKPKSVIESLFHFVKISACRDIATSRSDNSIRLQSKSRAIKTLLSVCRIRWTDKSTPRLE
jgi:hypothetical protein